MSILENNRSYGFSEYKLLNKVLIEQGGAYTQPRKEPVFQKEIRLTGEEIIQLKNKLNALKSSFETETLLMAVARGELVQEIGKTYSFSSIDDVCCALKERGVRYPRHYLDGSNSSFRINFSAPRHLSTEKYEKLIADLAGITGNSEADDLNRGEIIRAAFNEQVSVPPLMPAQGADTFGDFAQIKVLEVDIRDQLKKELDVVGGNLETMSPEHLESALTVANSVLNLQWLEKIPGMKNKAREVLAFEPMIQGVAGAVIIARLQKLGYGIYLSGSNKIRVVSNNLDANDVEAKLNAHLQKSATLSRALQSGMLYIQPSFNTYRESVTDKDGKIIDPNHTDINSYIEYLRKKPAQSLTIQEKGFLQTSQHFDKTMNFGQVLSQSKDFIKVIGLMEQFTGDTEMRNLLLGPQEKGSSLPVAAGVPAPAAGAPGASTDNSVAAKTGRGIGKLGEVIGKIAKTGAGGGLEFLGTVMSEAGGLGSVAIIGAILWSMFSSKGLGFMGTIGAIFGIGLVTHIDELKGILPKGKDKGGETSANAASASTKPSSAPSDIAPATEKLQSNQPLTHTALLARAMNRDNIHEANVDKEKSVISLVKEMNFVKLQQALEKGDQSSWQSALNSMNYDGLSPKKQGKISKIISDPEFGIPVLRKYIAHIDLSDALENLTPDLRQTKTLEQMQNLVVLSENEKLTKSIDGGDDLVPPRNIPSPESIVKKNAGYGDIVVLSRMIEYGYLPAVNFTKGEVAGKEGWMPRGIKAFIYVGLAGPVTNNVPGSNWFSGKNRHFEADFFKYLTNLIQVESAEIATRQQSVSAEPSFQPLRDELSARKEALAKLSEQLASKNPEAIKEALKAYREAAKTPWYSERIGKKEEFAEKEALKIADIELVNTKIEEEFKTMKTAQDMANVEGSTDAQKKAAVEATEKYNKSIGKLEAAGIKSLSQLPPVVRAELAKTNPWVARVASANGGMSKLDAKLTEYGNKGIAKGIMGAGLVGLLWNHHGGIMDLLNKGDFVTLSKRGFDFAAGALPYVSSLHETAILSNTNIPFVGEYRDFILGKDYKMSGLEKGFRVAGVVPLGGLVATIAGKGMIVLGEKISVGAVKKGGQMVEGVSDVVVAGAKTAGQIGTYGVLGYSAYHMTYDLSNHLTGSEVRQESPLHDVKPGRGTLS